MGQKNTVLTLYELTESEATLSEGIYDALGQPCMRSADLGRF
jgi:hypothetical protein